MLTKNKKDNLEISQCPHSNMKREREFLVCQDCGLILDENIAFNNSSSKNNYYKDSQLEYERKIRVTNSKAKQDPKVKQRYDKIQTLEKWFRDYKSNFTEQKKAIEFLKSYGLNIDKVKYQSIKNKYLKYNRTHRKTYQNMVIIFLAIVWMEIKDTTNVRIEDFFEICNDLGHKINKKMFNNATLKLRKAEKKLKKQYKKTSEIEKEIKNKIKILFQIDLNGIPHEKVREFFPHEVEFDKLKIEMQLLADKYLKKISYKQLSNLNLKAFTAGLIYYIGQTLDNRKIFTQDLIKSVSNFSSTTIRKKYNILKNILGDPHELVN